MKISVIIPTYNEENHISECLDSLSTQTYQDYEVIVVDDGSTDKTVSIIKSKRIKVLSQEHLGAGSARNLGSKNAKGEILVFIDADMIVSQNYLEQISKPIIEGNSKGTFTINEVVLNYHNIWAKLYNWEYIKEKTKLRIPSDHPNTAKVFRAILKSEFDRVGGYDEVGYGEDWTLSKKLKFNATSTSALVLHKNPSSLCQVFHQSSWIATRPYKMGGLGRIIALVRASFPFSIVFGIIGLVKYQNLFYPIFKIIYDAGLFYGIIKYWVTGKYAQ